MNATVSDVRFDTKLNAGILFSMCYIIIMLYKENFISLKCTYEYAYFYYDIVEDIPNLTAEENNDRKPHSTL